MDITSNCSCTDTSGTGADATATTLRFGAAAVILVVSVVASSFPTLAKHVPRIQPPEILFFVGKHFGTGVILSTAFVHLLQEGFESLSNPCLPGKWKEMSGLLVLLSFLSIFLIEYISTAYVERISHSDAHHHIHYHEDVHDHPFNHECSNHSIIPPYRDDDPEELPVVVEEALLISAENDPAAPLWDCRPLCTSIGHHRHEYSHARHHKVGPRLQQRQQIPVFIVPQQVPEEIQNGGHVHVSHGSAAEQAISRRTKLIGILVLQLGIMIHSIVIGLTLSITAGANFTTLFTAVIFHQLFEGLSLGIRISTLPSESRKARILPIVLCILFSMMAPMGVLLGMTVLPSRPPPSQGSNSFFDLQLQNIQASLLTRGLMCALSAGMLIYAAAVEMLAGDFVMNHEMRQQNFGRQALALGSLVLGTVAMAVIGIWA